jgi:hypothetical protein
MSTWSDQIRNRKKALEALDPKDRLEYVNGCVQSLLIVNESIGGWLQWMSDPTKMSKFSEEEIKHFFEFLKKFAIDFVDFDLEVTEKEKELTEKIKKSRVDLYR